MTRKIFRIALCTMLFTLSLSAEAQQPTKIPRIGYLGAASSTTPGITSTHSVQGLRELGYVEGKTIFIDYRWAEGKFDRLPGFAAELVRLNVDVIVSATPADPRC